MTETSSPLLDLLTQIDSGISIFEPFRRTSAELILQRDIDLLIISRKSEASGVVNEEIAKTKRERSQRAA